MGSARQKVFEHLNSISINYEVIEHTAVHTIEEMDALSLDPRNEVPKNLFVRDDKKKRFFLIVLQKYKTANLKDIMDKLGCRPLSFASVESLLSKLGLGKGAVTPFGVLNDTECAVEVVLDKDILAFERIGVHPNDNTATVWLSPSDLIAVIKMHGNNVLFIDI
jgi:Ala-tRNA(Pro) deacylase